MRWEGWGLRAGLGPGSWLSVYRSGQCRMLVLWDPGVFDSANNDPGILPALAPAAQAVPPILAFYGYAEVVKPGKWPHSAAQHRVSVVVMSVAWLLRSPHLPCCSSNQRSLRHRGSTISAVATAETEHVSAAGEKAD